jgi:hypothetical protein
MNVLPRVYVGAADLTYRYGLEVFHNQQTLQQAFPLAFREAGQVCSDPISKRSFC